MSRQVLNIQQMKHLKKLGVDTSSASMALVYRNANGDIVDWDLVQEYHELDLGRHNPYIRGKYGTFTLQDIIDLLPKEIDTEYERYNFEMWYGIYINKWCIGYINGENIYNDKCFIGDCLIDTAYETLCWYITNKPVKK